MRYRTLIATGLVAAAGMGIAGSAMAAPEVTGVEATKTGQTKLEVDVLSLRGTSATAPRITVTVQRRLARAKVSDWDPALPADELYVAAKELQAPYELVKEVAERGSLPVVLFTAGGIATPADAALMMQLGADGVFVGSGIFKSGDPVARANAIVQATRHYDDPGIVGKVSRGLGEAMVGINVADIPVHHRLEDRGW